MLARNRQEMIANELSRLAGDEYLEDMIQHMRHMEVGPHSPNCSYLLSPTPTITTNITLCHACLGVVVILDLA